MNPELHNLENTEATKEKHPVFQVTKTSKYFALILFISLPFIGGWIGYTYAPEKVVEVEKVPAAGVVTADIQDEWTSPRKDGLAVSKSYDAGAMTRMVIESPYKEKNGNYINDFNFDFSNSAYSLQFEFVRGIDFKPGNITHPDAWSGGTFELWFERNNQNGPGRENYMSIIALPKTNCSLSRCELSVLETVKIGNYEWDFLGSRRYCDAGECGGKEYVYKYKLGDYELYVESDTDLTNIPEDQEFYFSRILSTLTFELIP